MRRCAVTTSTYAKPASAVRKFDVADEFVLERGEREGDRPVAGVLNLELQLILRDRSTADRAGLSDSWTAPDTVGEAWG
jgi:hypothetical protein